MARGIFCVCRAERKSKLKTRVAVLTQSGKQTGALVFSFVKKFAVRKGAKRPPMPPLNITLYDLQVSCALDTFCALWFDSSACVAVVKGAEAKRTRQSEPLTTTPLSNCFSVEQPAVPPAPRGERVDGCRGNPPAGGLGASPH